MKPKILLLTLFLTLYALTQSAFAQSFEYEKREPIRVPSDFPLIMIPAFHRGDDQSDIVLKKLNSLPKEAPLVLWTETKGIGAHRLSPAVESLIRTGETHFAGQSLLLDDSIRKKMSTSAQGVDPILKRYVEIDSYFARWNQWGADAETAEQKKNEVKQVFEKEFFARLISWGVDHRSVVSAEEKSMEAWQAIIRMFHLTEQADLRLSYGDVEGAYRAKESEFKYTVEMVYLRNRKIWEQFQQLHRQYPRYKIVAVIGEAHAPDFHLSNGQLLKLSGDIAPDASRELTTIEKELEGKLSARDRRVFIWNNYLKQKLIGQAPDTSNFKVLSQITEKVYGRMAMEHVDAQQLLRRVGEKVLRLRNANPEAKNFSYSGLERKILIDTLAQNKLITPRERGAFEGQTSR